MVLFLKTKQLGMIMLYFVQVLSYWTTRDYMNIAVLYNEIVPCAASPPFPTFLGVSSLIGCYNGGVKCSLSLYTGYSIHKMFEIFFYN